MFIRCGTGITDCYFCAVSYPCHEALCTLCMCQLNVLPVQCGGLVMPRAHFFICLAWGQPHCLDTFNSSRIIFLVSLSTSVIEAQCWRCYAFKFRQPLVACLISSFYYFSPPHHLPPTHFFIPQQQMIFSSTQIGWSCVICQVQRLWQFSVEGKLVRMRVEFNLLWLEVPWLWRP